MAKLLRLRRGTTTQHGSFTGAEGEVTVDTDKDTLVVHDNSTAGGRPMLREDLNNMPSSGVTAGTYGSASAIPAITVDAKGRVTSATTNAIDSTTISNGTSNVSVAASGDITLTRAGTTQATVIGGGLKFGDGKRAFWGDDTDLQIWHDGSNSYIKDNGTGDIVIETRNFVVRDISGETHITATVNSSVDLYHDNSKKLNTTSGGINVTGTVTCDGMTCEGSALISAGSGVLQIRDNDGTGGANSVVYIQGQRNDGTGIWTLGDVDSTADIYLANASDATIYFQTNGVNRVGINNGGLFPHANNTSDLGTSSKQWKDAYFDGTVYCDGLEADGSVTLKNTTGITILQDTNSTGSSAQNYISARDSGNTQQWFLGQTSSGDNGVTFMQVQNGSMTFGTNNTWRAYFSNSGHFVPYADNTYDLGTSTTEWRNAYFDGTVFTDGLEVTATANLSSKVYSTERTATASSFNLATGNFWTFGAIAVPNPANQTAGMSGLLRVTAAPTSFASNWKFPGGSYTAPTSFPAVAPFFVQASGTILVGNWTEGIT